MYTSGYTNSGDSMPLEVFWSKTVPGDVRLTQEAVQAANTAVRLHVLPTGIEAMAFLKREGVHADAPRPDLTLLDLNMPNGWPRRSGSHQEG
jgi:chemotaxis family two-component system response regulator Rcp1